MMSRDIDPDRVKLKFMNFLLQNEEVMTRGQAFMLECVIEFPGHFSVDELYVLMANKLAGRVITGVSRATLYRQVDVMVQAGVLQEITLGERHRSYELSFGLHPHLDMICGEVIEEIVSPEMEKLLRDIASQRGVEILSASVVVKVRKG